MKTWRMRAAALLCLTMGVAKAYELQPPQARETGSFADAVAIGDVDGDGRDDVVLTTKAVGDDENDKKIFVYLQSKNGVLADPVRVPYPRANTSGLVLADLDHDGAEEIVAGDDEGITILKWNKWERLRRIHTYSGLIEGRAIAGVATLDVDRDGNLDIAGESVVFFGDGYGGIREKSLIGPGGWDDVKSGDINGDGYADLMALTGQGTTRIYIYYNDGTKDLSTPTVLIPNPSDPVFYGSIGVGDFNGDNRNDLIAMHDQVNLTLFTQTANGTLGAGSVIAPYGGDENAMQGADMDGDGKTDLVIAHGGGWLGVLYQNDGALQAEVPYGGKYATWLNPQGLAVGDINNDGCKDAAIANYNYGLVTYLGSGCVQRADLLPSLGLTRNIVTLRVDNAGNAAANDTHASLMLSVTNGSLALGALPSGCSLVSQSDRNAQLDCSYGSMAASASETRTLSYQVAGGDLRNAVVAKAGVATSSPESKTNNNSASKRLMPGF